MATPTLPAPPRALAAILDAASDPSVPLGHLANLVAQDPTFAGLILQVANSADRRGANPITHLRQATTRLGVRTVRNYALCHAARSCTSARELGVFNLDSFWEDSIRRAVAAETLAQHTGYPDPQLAFTVGLLMELGVVALILAQPSHAETWHRIRHADPAIRLDDERRLFGLTHAEVNSELARDWQLPDELSVPMIHHHHPDAAPAPMRRLCALAGTAEALAVVLASEEKRAALDRAARFLEDLSGIHDPAPLLEELGERVQHVGQMMGIKVGPQPSLEDILQAANRSLIEANLSYEDLVQKLEAVIAEKDALAVALDERNRELERLSTTDVLTRLPNRRHLFQRLDEELHRVRRHGGCLTIMVVDIDHFKRVNDSHGHVFGDHVLAEIAGVLAGNARTNDIPARIGGEEFAVLLPETGLHGASAVAHRMLGAVARLVLPSPKQDAVRTTVSIGIAGVEGPHPAPVDMPTVATRLYRAADAALYRSKQAGRNRVSMARQPLEWALTTAPVVG